MDICRDLARQDSGFSQQTTPPVPLLQQGHYYYSGQLLTWIYSQAGVLLPKHRHLLGNSLVTGGRPVSPGCPSTMTSMRQARLLPFLCPLPHYVMFENVPCTFCTFRPTAASFGYYLPLPNSKKTEYKQESLSH